MVSTLDLAKYGLLGLAAFAVLTKGKEIGTFLGTGAGNIVGSAFTGFAGATSAGLSSALGQIGQAGYSAGRSAMEERQATLTAKAEAGQYIPSDTGQVLVSYQGKQFYVSEQEALSLAYMKSEPAPTGVSEAKPTGVSNTQSTGQIGTTDVVKQFYAGTAGIQDVISSIGAGQTATVQESVSKVSTQTGQQNISPPGISAGHQVISKSLQLKYYGQIIYPNAPE